MDEDLKRRINGIRPYINGLSSRILFKYLRDIELAMCLSTNLRFEDSLFIHKLFVAITKVQIATKAINLVKTSILKTKFQFEIKSDVLERALTWGVFAILRSPVMQVIGKADKEKWGKAEPFVSISNREIPNIDVFDFMLIIEKFDAQTLAYLFAPDGVKAKSPRINTKKSGIPSVLESLDAIFEDSIKATDTQIELWIAEIESKKRRKLSSK